MTLGADSVWFWKDFTDYLSIYCEGSKGPREEACSKPCCPVVALLGLLFPLENRVIEHLAAAPSLIDEHGHLIYWGHLELVLAKVCTFQMTFSPSKDLGADFCAAARACACGGQRTAWSVVSMGTIHLPQIPETGICLTLPLQHWDYKHRLPCAPHPTPFFFHMSSRTRTQVLILAR